MLFRYLKGAGLSLFIGITIFLMTVELTNEYLKTHLLFITLYNYICCVIGIIAFVLISKFNLFSNRILGVVVFIILGAVASFSFLPLYYIFIAGSVAFYLIQLNQSKRVSVISAISGPVLLLIFLIVL